MEHPQNYTLQNPSYLGPTDTNFRQSGYPTSTLDGSLDKGISQDFDALRPALRTLHRAGFHFVLCNPDKTPLEGYSWKRRRSLKAVLAHVKAGGLVGIVPASGGYAVLDVDEGQLESIGNFLANFPPAALVPSRQPGRFHIWYPDSTADRGNANWIAEEYAIGGQIRAAAGYVCLHGPAAAALVQQFDNPGGIPWRFADLPLSYPAGEDGGGPPSSPAELRAAFDDGDWLGPISESLGRQLATIQKGRRNQNLFDFTRKRAYKAVFSFDTAQDFTGAVADFLERANAYLPLPEESNRIGYTGKSIAKWTWRNIRGGAARGPGHGHGGNFTGQVLAGWQHYHADHAKDCDCPDCLCFSWQQSCRRRRRAALDRERLGPRNARITRAAIEGQTTGQLAKAYGLSRRQIHRILASTIEGRYALSERRKRREWRISTAQAALDNGESWAATGRAAGVSVTTLKRWVTGGELNAERGKEGRKEMNNQSVSFPILYPNSLSNYPINPSLYRQERAAYRPTTDKVAGLGVPVFQIQTGGIARRGGPTGNTGPPDMGR